MFVHEPTCLLTDVLVIAAPVEPVVLAFHAERGRIILQSDEEHHRAVAFVLLLRGNFPPPHAFQVAPGEKLFVS